MKLFSKIAGSVLVIAALALGAIVFLGNQKYDTKMNFRYADVSEVDVSEEMKTADIELGRRIVHIRNGCVDCHGESLSGKQFIDGPPGKFFGSNLTPAALSAWSDGEIARAITQGIGKEQQALQIMPSAEYRNMSKQDVASVIQYLRSLAPVEESVPRSEAALLMKTLYLFGSAPNLFPVESIDLNNSEFLAKPAEALTAEFGKYIVRTSCIGCHGETLAGGRIPGGPPDWPEASDLRPSAIQGWGEHGFFKTMRTGINPMGKNLRAPMPVEMTKQYSDTELKAVWLYLQKI